MTITSLTLAVVVSNTNHDFNFEVQLIFAQYHTVVHYYSAMHSVNKPVEMCSV
jgi:hypothetical protein